MSYDKDQLNNRYPTHNQNQNLTAFNYYASGSSRQAHQSRLTSDACPANQATANPASPTNPAYQAHPNYQAFQPNQAYHPNMAYHSNPAFHAQHAYPPYRASPPFYTNQGNPLDFSAHRSNLPFQGNPRAYGANRANFPFQGNPGFPPWQYTPRSRSSHPTLTDYQRSFFSTPPIETPRASNSAHLAHAATALHNNAPRSNISMYPIAEDRPANARPCLYKNSTPPANQEASKQIDEHDPTRLSISLYQQVGPQNQKDMIKNMLLAFYKCLVDNCPFVTEDSGEMEAHMGQYHPGALRICPYCTYINQNDARSLIHHMELHRNETFQCGFCFFRTDHLLKSVKHFHNEHSDRGGASIIGIIIYKLDDIMGHKRITVNVSFDH